MSKASEWSRLNDEVQLRWPQNEVRVVGGGLVLTFYNRDGNIASQIAYTDVEAIKVARFMLEVLGDEQDVGQASPSAAPDDPHRASVSP